MPNRLASETSPYLLQHKDNPVDWYPWGPEAIERAKAEDKPIFLSIGYSACHWCHVMEHESFENDEIAALMNEKFVNIKVDREERPDLDHIYMNAVQMMTGRGGWPMSVFLTPDLEPFYGGTYWPPHGRMGIPGFVQVIAAIDEGWRTRRKQVNEQGARLTQHLREFEIGKRSDAGPSMELLQTAAAKLQREFDTVHGGFGSQPKFPHSMALQFMLRVWHRTGRGGLLDMVRLNLDKMAQGGIYDHLGGGFARYSVDERWLVPHFEKMLYDNALLTGAYLDGYLATGESKYACVVKETLDYVLNYMTDERGAFHSTEDADSEGEEGKFYVWTPDEVKRVLGEECGERFCYVYDVSETGNFEGKNILNLPKTIEQCAKLKGWDPEPLRAELAESRRKLLEIRDRRVRPGKDDKVLVSWNALMIESMARAAGVLDEPRYLQAAAGAAEFVLREMSRDDGRLLHCWRHGQAKLDAYLDDYAYLINSLVTLYEADFDERWIDEAVRLADIVLEHFADREAGGFFYTADDHERLITRNKEMDDSDVPSGNSMAATALLRLGKLCGRDDYMEAARSVVDLAVGVMDRLPLGMGQMLVAADMVLGSMPEIAVVGDKTGQDTAPAISDLRKRFIPRRVVACRSPKETGGSAALDPLFSGKESVQAEPTVFLCDNFACEAPVAGTQAVTELLERLARVGE